MTSTANERSPFADLPPLPASVTTKDGTVFDPRPDEWSIPSLQHHIGKMNFQKMPLLTPEFKHKLKLGFAKSIETATCGSVRAIFDRFFRFYREELAVLKVPCDQITIAHLINYRAKQQPATEWRLGHLRPLLLDMHACGYGTCSDEAVRFLRNATFKGTLRDVSTRTRDRKRGAFNDTELLSMGAALNVAYAEGTIDLPEYVLTWLFLAYGARPIQIAALKESDLVVSTSANGDRRYALQMPRAKQRLRLRSSFKMRYCSKQIGGLLDLLIERNRLLKTDPDVAEGDWPLFIGARSGDVPDLRYHMPPARLGERLGKTIGRIIDLKANPKRFRITLAQRAVDDGKDKYTVAELLDHSNTSNVMVYFEASPAMVERLDRHLALELAPLAQAFAGVLVVSEASARRGDDLRSRIYDKTLPNNVDRPLGTCGQMSFCGLHAPFACYTCRNFQPWLDADHDEFLQALIGERDRMIAEGYSPRIYNIQNRTILAVAEVIRLCTAEPKMPGGSA